MARRPNKKFTPEYAVGDEVFLVYYKRGRSPKNKTVREFFTFLKTKIVAVTIGCKNGCCFEYRIRPRVYPEDVFQADLHKYEEDAVERCELLNAI